MNLIRRGSSRSAVNHTSPPHGRSTSLRCSLNGAVPPLLLTYELLDPIQPARELRHGCRIRDSYVLSGSECLARYHRDVLFGEKFLRKLKRRRNPAAECDGDVGIRVEGALRFGDLHAGNSAKALHDVIAPLAVFG